MNVSRTFLLFLLYSVMGWIYETVYCTAKDRKWENRGFLYGPACPIYGFGALAASGAVRFAAARWGILPPWGVYVLCVAGSAVLEYGTSWLLERLFHAVWWDYSRLPFNLHGRISLFTSCGFGVAGVLIVYYIAPFTEHMTDRLSLSGIEALSLVGMALFAADCTLTVSALTDLARTVKQAEALLNERMESLVDTAYQKTSGAKDRMALAREGMLRRMENMSALRRMAVRRVRGLRSPRLDREPLSRLLADLKTSLFSRRK